DTFRPAAEEIRRVVAPAEPLYLFGFEEEVAPLLFYLDRDAPLLDGRLGDAPPGYVLVPEPVWKTHQAEALDLEPVLTSEHGHRRLVLLKRGKSYARLKEWAGDLWNASLRILSPGLPRRWHGSGAPLSSTPCSGSTSPDDR
ncbi:MAG TPA: hypothetical protein VIX12_02410, partial [Candidatus Binataceae bacterium]